MSDSDEYDVACVWLMRWRISRPEVERTDDLQGKAEYNEGTPHSILVCISSQYQDNDGSGDIDRHCQQLGIEVVVTLAA